MSSYFKYLFIFIFFFSNPYVGFSQAQPIINVSINIIKFDKNPQLIIFQQDRTLRYTDFQGKPPAVTEGVAATYSGIKMGISATEEKSKIEITIDLTCYFDPSRSWMKKDGKTPAVLEHEQCHFNLTFIQMCRLSDAITKYKFTKNWNAELKALRKEYMDELDMLQDNYDKKTIHGTIKEQQFIFSQQINTQLKETNCNPN